LLYRLTQPLFGWLCHRWTRKDRAAYEWETAFARRDRRRSS
jgi:hypothetical protein